MAELFFFLIFFCTLHAPPACLFLWIECVMTLYLSKISSQSALNFSTFPNDLHKLSTSFLSKGGVCVFVLSACVPCVPSQALSTQVVVEGLKRHNFFFGTSLVYLRSTEVCMFKNLFFLFFFFFVFPKRNTTIGLEGQVPYSYQIIDKNKKIEEKS